MAHYVWVVLVLSPRDGGWVRHGGHFRTEEAGWQYMEVFWNMLVMAGDYVTLDVKKTISF